MNYYKKYIKYKNKYLNIKKGGIRKEDIYDTLGVVLEHGSILPDTVFTVPHNIKLIISNNCGIYNFGSEMNESKYKGLESKINNKTLLTKDEFYELINSSNYEVIINDYTYKVIEPNTQICNVFISPDLKLSGFKKIKFESNFQNNYNTHTMLSITYIMEKLFFYTKNIQEFKKLITQKYMTSYNKFYISQNIIFYEFMLFIKNIYNNYYNINLLFEQILTDQEIENILQILIVKLSDDNPNSILMTLLENCAVYNYENQEYLDILTRLEQTSYDSLSMYNVCIILFLYLYEYNEYSDSPTLSDKINEFSTEIPAGQIGYVFVISCLVVPTGKESLTSVKVCLDKYYQLESEIPLLTINMINTKLNTKFNIHNYLIAPAEVICNKLIPNKEEFIASFKTEVFNLFITHFMNIYYSENNKIELFIKNFISNPENIKTLHTVDVNKFNIFPEIMTDMIRERINEYNSPIYFLIYYIFLKYKRLKKTTLELKPEFLMNNLLSDMFSADLSNMEKLIKLQEYQKTIIENRNKFLIFQLINFEYMESILDYKKIREEQLSISSVHKVISKNISTEGFIKIDKIFTKSKNPEFLQLIFLSSEDISKEIKIKQNKDIEEDYAIIEEDNLTVDKKSYNILFHYFLELPYNRLLGK